MQQRDMVEAGDPLIRLDTTQLQSRMISPRSQHGELLAQQSRLTADRDRADDLTFDPDLLEWAEPDLELAELIED
ncbi:hypothetical protein SAMN04488020_10819 [Palleronia marisminoris]|uniref:HlyD family secretion protein n=1 Tax=Palleronia marisminoris TaxID=315423 RepID=A0A1Y5T6K6_9RHOB|nr:hypothetical protein [Palleronia marisminoris]SFH20624.1 hypothetical protein SAMN04488020_10819 [Palleronia marisminoris]SLN57009.1 HlyD family secretion protein [Palleronia marisminoris]